MKSILDEKIIVQQSCKIIDQNFYWSVIFKYK